MSGSVLIRNPNKIRVLRDALFYILRGKRGSRLGVRIEISQSRGLSIMRYRFGRYVTTYLLLVYYVTVYS